MYPALEISIPTQHCSNDKLAFFNPLGNRRRQWPAVSYASRATITHKIKAQCIKVIHHIRFHQIICDHLGTGCQTCLHPRLCLQTFGYRFLRNQACCKHHGRIRSVGATSDCCNNHRTMLENLLLVIHGNNSLRIRSCRADPSLRLGLGDQTRQRTVERSFHIA